MTSASMLVLLKLILQVQWLLPVAIPAAVVVAVVAVTAAFITVLATLVG